MPHQPNVATIDVHSRHWPPLGHPSCIIGACRLCLSSQTQGHPFPGTLLISIRFHSFYFCHLTERSVRPDVAVAGQTHWPSTLNLRSSTFTKHPKQSSAPTHPPMVASACRLPPLRSQPLCTLTTFSQRACCDAKVLHGTVVSGEYKCVVKTSSARSPFLTNSVHTHLLSAPFPRLSPCE